MQPFASHLTVSEPIKKFTEPIIRLSYRPDPPTFTIRTIIDAINAITSDSGTHFVATVHHPPSLEDRAQRMQIQEQRALLYRLIFTVVVAIPTFIVGVVYMSLVPSSNHIRMWFMEPMWAGNASRMDWAMFFLATPVMVYGAGIFHRRSAKEIYALWRKGSRTPVWRRFVRFGSMNLLVCTYSAIHTAWTVTDILVQVSAGVSVAYFSSIVLLALAASDQPSPTGNGDETTYFDSVVFLTMFLLAGELIRFCFPLVRMLIVE